MRPSGSLAWMVGLIVGCGGGVEAPAVERQSHALREDAGVTCVVGVSVDGAPTLVCDVAVDPPDPDRLLADPPEPDAEPPQPDKRAETEPPEPDKRFATDPPDPDADPPQPDLQR